MQIAAQKGGRTEFWFEADSSIQLQLNDRRFKSKNDFVSYTMEKRTWKDFVSGNFFTRAELDSLLKAESIHTTYPFHERAAFVAKKFHSKLYIFEEGVCFYKIPDYEPFRLRRSIYKILIYIAGLGAELDYSKRKFKGYSLIEASHFKNIKFAVPLRKTHQTGKALLLSRPIIQDMGSVKNDELSEQLVYWFTRLKQSRPNIKQIELKHHPRESTSDQNFIRNILLESAWDFSIENSNSNAEEIVKENQYEALIGCDTSTLAYSSILCPETEVLSFLKVACPFDKTLRLTSIYRNFERIFKHIKYG